MPAASSAAVAASRTSSRIGWSHHRVPSVTRVSIANRSPAGARVRLPADNSRVETCHCRTHSPAVSFHPSRQWFGKPWFDTARAPAASQV